MTHAFCPNCGANFAKDAPVELDGWRVGLTDVEHDGERTRLTAAEALVLHSIAAAGGEPVRSSVLAERADCASDHNVIQVLVCRLRKKLPGVPIETVSSRGYRWARAA